MKAALLCVLALAALSQARPFTLTHLDASALFQQFKMQHNRQYVSADEEQARFSIFQDNLKTIEALNQGEDMTPFGINKFADLTPEEFRSKYLLPKGFLEPRLAARRQNAEYADLSRFTSSPLPNAFDWRNKNNTVTAVKDQQQCGSCWAFSTTENVESVWAIQGGNPLTELSVEQIVQCDKKDDGCNGGDLPTAFEYVIGAGGLETEKSYPYTSGDGVTGKCHDQSGLEVAKIDGWHYATRNKNETEMQVYLMNVAPLAICVDAETWQFYNKGIVKRNCGKQLDHCVQLTGWNQQSNVPYWVVRNSWNTDWGEDGYIYIERNEDLCGIGKEPTSSYINH